MQAGKLGTRIQLQSATTGRDAIGGVTKSWTTYATVWADLKPMQGDERKVADRMQARTTHEIVIRWRNDVKKNHRVMLSESGRIFEIDRAYDPNSRKFAFVLECVEVEQYS